jgi:hypothetical protein
MNKADRLRNLIARTIEEAPYDFEGFRWAAKPQREWRTLLGFSPATLRRLAAQQPPFVRDCTHVDGRKMMLLRVGEPGPKTARQLAKTMTYIWRKRFGRSVSRPDFGRLVGLAEVWPDGDQLEIFKAVLDNWPAFMVGAKLVIAAEGRRCKKRLDYPCITWMRRFDKVGIELYVKRLQEQGKFSVQMQDKYLPLMA